MFPSSERWETIEEAESRTFNAPFVLSAVKFASTLTP